ncbi:hypothetical protein CN176_03520 [Sinorhizobium medicae]|uniref:hypothetical protein n=1 Tax=Sinorhizobium medicae TaxID=110321 RepID=UPI000FD8698F|nr:hypothetical protein [Sinorhizobium medicae]RVJ45867.1 hypothetical protein CN176_03520 [Sinorhizobium medicae]
MEVDTNLAGDVAVAVATLLAALVGGILAWWINRAADRRRTASERELQILKALEFLTGGTQKRSAGIGLLEGLFNEFESNGPLRAVFVPVVRNQLIYLSTSSDPKSELHEHDNFFRLVDVWFKLQPSALDQDSLKQTLKLRRTGRGLEFSDTPYAEKFRDFRRSLGLLDERTDPPSSQ